MNAVVSWNELVSTLAARCPRCAAVDPLLHAAEPRGPGDWLLVAISVVVLAAALAAAFKLLWFPGERAAQHVKRSILDDSLPSVPSSAEVRGHE